MTYSITEFLLIGTQAQLNKLSSSEISVGNCNVKCVSEVRNLGAWFDKSWSMKKHVSVKTKAAFHHIYNISKIRSHLSKGATDSLLHGLVYSHLDYSNALLNGIPDYVVNKLHSVQNYAARVVTWARRFNHVTPLLKSLHWLPVAYRIRYKVLLLVYRSTHGMAPAYKTCVYKRCSPGTVYALMLHQCLIFPALSAPL